MEGIIAIVVIYFLIRFLYKRFKGMAQTASQAQEQTEGTKPKPVEKPVVKQADFRFPPVKPKPGPKPVSQEGRDPGALVMGEYTPISPSTDLKNQFSDYQGSLQPPATEGVGYEAEAYDPVATAYRVNGNAEVQVLPERFSRDTLLQAVVMSEVLKRPRALR